MNAPSREFGIRRMAAADLDRVIAISASLKQSPQWQRAAYVAALDPEAAPRRIALVAEDATTGQIAGFAVASLTPPEAELETIAVEAEFQRRGAARQLFLALADEMRAERVRDVFLEVRESNQQALALYRGLGFAEAGRRPRYYADPVEDAVLMRLRLG